MRKQGLAKADKKAARVAAEGVIAIAAAARWAVRPRWSRSIARPTSWRVSKIFAPSLKQVAAWPSPQRPASLAGAADAGRCPAARVSMSAVERWSLRSARTSACGASRVLDRRGQLGAYVHGTRIGALVAMKGGDAALAHDLAMHVAASNPQLPVARARCAGGHRQGARRCSPSRLAAKASRRR